jgi:hypothetical protein
MKQVPLPQDVISSGKEGNVDEALKIAEKVVHLSSSSVEGQRPSRSCNRDSRTSGRDHIFTEERGLCLTLHAEDVNRHQRTKLAASGESE